MDGSRFLKRLVLGRVTVMIKEYPPWECRPLPFPGLKADLKHQYIVNKRQYIVVDCELWLPGSGGSCYLVIPPGVPLPGERRAE